MTEDQIKQLLKKYSEDTASPVERIQVEDWYAQLNLPGDEVSALRKSSIRKQMLRSIQSVMAGKPISKSFLSRQWIGVAASVTIVAALSIVFWKPNLKHQTSSTQLVVSTKSGERRKFSLSDGSVITLSPFASVSFPRRFNNVKRQIKLLEGEAFFSVAHDTERPFTVELPSNFKVSVLGTSFRIRYYNADSNMDVAVTTGKVAVIKKGKLLGTLTKDQKLQYNRLTGKFDIRADQHIHSVKIEFEGATLEQVIRRMEYVYTIEIQIQNRSLLGLKTTATFNSAQSPEEILGIIGSLHHIKIIPDKHHKTFKIY
jgi:transmembrane sensor